MKQAWIGRDYRTRQVIECAPYGSRMPGLRAVVEAHDLDGLDVYSDRIEIRRGDETASAPIIATPTTHWGADCVTAAEAAARILDGGG